MIKSIIILDQVKTIKLLNKILCLGTAILGFSTPLFSTIPVTIAQSGVNQAVIFAPPSIAKLTKK